MPPTLHVLFCEQDPARPITSATSELGIAAPWQESNSSVTEFTDCVCFILLPASKNPRRFKLRAAHGYIGTSQRWGIFWIPETVSVSMSWTKSRCVDNKPKFWFLSLSFQISAKSKSFKVIQIYKILQTKNGSGMVWPRKIAICPEKILTFGSANSMCSLRMTIRRHTEAIFRNNLRTWLIYQTSGNLMLEKDGKSARCGFRVSNFCPFWFQTIRTQGNKGGRAAAPCQADQRCALVFSTGSRVLTSTAWKVMICKWFNDKCHDDTWYAWYVMTM